MRMLKTRQTLWYALILFGVFATQAGYAQEEESGGIFDAFEDTFDGYVKQETAVRLDELDHFVKIKNSLELTYKQWFTDQVGITITGLGVYDAVYDVDDDLVVEDEEDYRAYVDLREAVVDITAGKFDIRLGKQQVVWGKTDGFQVTDIVNPIDLREFGLPELVDMRIPLWIGKIDYYVTDEFSLEFVVIPEMQFTEYAHAGSEYAFATPPLPPGLLPIINPIEEPDESFENTEYGVKFSGFYKGWDFTLNYLYSWEDGIILKQALDMANGTITISPTHERLHIVGGSFATVLWRAVVRGELAAHIGKYFAVEDVTVADMVVEKTLLNYALAVEGDIFDIFWLFQGFQEIILDYDDMITEEDVKTTLTLRGAKKFMNDTLDITVSGAYEVHEHDFLISPSIQYALTDSLSLKGGADIFGGGDETSLFGQFDDKDRLYVELKYSF